MSMAMLPRCLGTSGERAVRLSAPMLQRQAPAFPTTLPQDYLPYRLAEKWDVSPDTKLLRFSLPEEVPSLEKLGVLSTVKLRRMVNGSMLEKSYSPVSLPGAEGFVDLLVKKYAPRPGGGLAFSLSGLQKGNGVEMKLMAPRTLGGMPYAANRYSDLVLVGNGSGVVPLHQLTRQVMSDPQDQTRVCFVAAHRTEMDVLMLEELKYWAHCNPDRFKLHLALSKPFDIEAWEATCRGDDPSSALITSAGRLDLEALRQHLPTPSAETMAVVCGTDGFLEDVCGKEEQGAVDGMLANLGFTSEIVTRL